MLHVLRERPGAFPLSATSCEEDTSSARVTVVRMRQMRPDSIPGSATGAGNIIITERFHIKMTWLRLNLSEVSGKTKISDLALY
ncbi:hypothetical protein ZB23_17505 [Salmonella enterica subsp. enterica]|nr:hypothetical protein [Salmonella enterica subsp. enterica serovar Manchester]